jgi:hypothetical protein
MCAGTSTTMGTRTGCCLDGELTRSQPGEDGWRLLDCELLLWQVPDKAGVLAGQVCEGHPRLLRKF